MLTFPSPPPNEVSGEPSALYDAAVKFVWPARVTALPVTRIRPPERNVMSEGSSLRPGRTGIVKAASPDGTLTIEIDGNHVGVGAFASERILVTA